MRHMGVVTDEDALVRLKERGEYVKTRIANPHSTRATVRRLGRYFGVSMGVGEGLLEDGLARRLGHRSAQVPSGLEHLGAAKQPGIGAAPQRHR